MIGIKPVENFSIETIYDPWDYRITEFRKMIFTQDLGLDQKTIEINEPYSWWHENLNYKVFEDAFKYSNRKWKNTNFDNIEALIEKDKIVGISGCRIYNNFLRISMHLYLLKSVRSKYPGIKYLKGGWFERHLNYATKNKCDGIFFTVYAHNKKLKGLINNHRGKIISLIDKKHLLYIHDVKEKGEYLFNFVPQTFFYFPLTKTIEEFDPNVFI